MTRERLRLSGEPLGVSGGNEGYVRIDEFGGRMEWVLTDKLSRRCAEALILHYPGGIDATGE